MFTPRLSLSHSIYEYHKSAIEFIASQIIIICISVYTVILITYIYCVISVCGSNKE
jgi:hypothetical protein